MIAGGDYPCRPETPSHESVRSTDYPVMSVKRPFESAVNEHGATVLRVCRAALGPGPDADDAWSETFLAALRSWDGLPEDTRVEAWLVRVAQRKAVDVIRRRSRQVPTEFLPGPAGHDRNEGADVWEAVARLPERQRLAVAYHYFGGLPHTETAELIGGTSAAVRRAAADGIRTLRSALGVDITDRAPADHHPTAVPEGAPQ